MKIREIRKIVAGRYRIDGMGVKLIRFIGQEDTEAFDPFLMLDVFDSFNPADYLNGFPSHPHRGIETVTYLIEGAIDHSDSLGHKDTIFSGGVQWMTAGKGVIHQEMPQPVAHMQGFQLWLNLPAEHKMAPPEYRGFPMAAIPQISANGSTVRVISGSWHDVPGAVTGNYVEATLLDVALERGAEWTMPVSEQDTLFVCVFSGSVSFGMNSDTYIEKHNAVLFNEGDEFIARAGNSGARFILFSAPPLRESVAWEGSIVMNTRQELQQAFEEIRLETFVPEEPPAEEPEAESETEPSTEPDGFPENEPEREWMQPKSPAPEETQSE